MFLLDTTLFDQAVAENLAGIDAIFEAGVSPPLEVILVQGPFTPSKAPNPLDIIMATFDGGDPLNTAASGPVTQVLDSASGRIGYLMNEPVGGFRWICSGATDLPQTIVGVIVRNSADEIWFSGLLDTPKTITAPGDFIELSGLLGYLQSDLFAPV